MSFILETLIVVLLYPAEQCDYELKAQKGLGIADHS